MEDLLDPQEMGEGRKGCHRVSAADLGMRLIDWTQWEEGMMKVFSWFTISLALLSCCVFPVNACRCWRLGFWDELGEGRLEGKIFVIVGDGVRE